MPTLASHRGSRSVRRRRRGRSRRSRLSERLFVASQCFERRKSSRPRRHQPVRPPPRNALALSPCTRTLQGPLPRLPHRCSETTLAPLRLNTAQHQLFALKPPSSNTSLPPATLPNPNLSVRTGLLPPTPSKPTASSLFPSATLLRSVTAALPLHPLLRRLVDGRERRLLVRG